MIAALSNAQLSIAASTIWVADRGGTHGPPTNPLLLRVGSRTRIEAAHGPGPASPSTRSVREGGERDV
jgi:hypothetical protein